jgi:hypothetical protein
VEEVTVEGCTLTRTSHRNALPEVAVTGVLKQPRDVSDKSWTDTVTTRDSRGHLRLASLV